MAMDTATQEKDNVNYFQSGVNDYNALRVRLDTEELLDRVELFLTGKKYSVETDKEGNQILNKIEMGDPLANNLGIQQILSLVSSVVNKDVVQGNLTGDEINQIVKDVKLDLAYQFMINADSWAVATKNRKHIVRTIEKTAKLFLSRTKDNKERESYNQSLRSVESNVIQKPKSAFNMFQNQ